MTPYRKALIEHMTLRGLSEKTLDAYVYWMRDLCAFINHTPDRITLEDVRRFLVHLIADRGLAYSTVNQAKCGILYFFRHVMGTPSVVADLPPMKQGSALPEVLSQPEVVRLFQAPLPPRDPILLKVAYGCGLRLGELISLRLLDIQRDRGMVFVQGGKGNKDRYVPLSERLLRELELYFQICLSWNRNGEKSPWLFPSPRDCRKPIHESVAQRAFDKAKELAGIRRGKGLHTLRHCYAVHSLELGVDLKTLQYRLGHANIRSTFLYLRVASVPHHPVISPYDFLEERSPQKPGKDQGKTDEDQKEGNDRQA